MNQFNRPENGEPEANFEAGHRIPPANRAALRYALTGGRTAIWQARLVLLVMINIAQLWILSATIEAALAGHYKQLVPLVVASGICWLTALTIFLWWKPAARRLRLREFKPPR